MSATNMSGRADIPAPPFRTWMTAQFWYISHSRLNHDHESSASPEGADFGIVKLRVGINCVAAGQDPMKLRMTLKDAPLS